LWELWGVEISAFPLTWHIAYTTACGCRTSREEGTKVEKVKFSGNFAAVDILLSYHNI